MVMGIVICMAKRESANFHSVPTMSNPMASVSNMAIKRKHAVTTDAQTMPSGMVFLRQSWCKALLHNPWLCHAVVSGTEVQISLQVSFGGAS